MHFSCCRSSVFFLLRLSAISSLFLIGTVVDGWMAWMLCYSIILFLSFFSFSVSPLVCVYPSAHGELSRYIISGMHAYYTPYRSLIPDGCWLVGLFFFFLLLRCIIMSAIWLIVCVFAVCSSFPFFFFGHFFFILLTELFMLRFDSIVFKPKVRPELWMPRFFVQFFHLLCLFL